jgi:hypothetical protein
MAHDGFVSVRTILGCIGVGEAFEGVAVAGLDGIEPGLFDWKAKTGMVKSNQGANAGQIKAAPIKGSTSRPGSQSNSLGGTVEVVYRVGGPGRAGGEDTLAGMRMERSDWWRVQSGLLWVDVICSALFRLDTPPERAIFVYVMGRKSKCDPLAWGCMSALLASGLTCSCPSPPPLSFPWRTWGDGQLALVETGFSALVEAETQFCFLMEADTCFSVDLLIHFRFLGVRLTSADRARGGGGVIDSCGGCDAISTATYAASAVSGMGT